jgi:hypothetical protein
MAGMRDVGKARLAALGGLVAAGLVLAACGGGGSSSASANTASSTTTTVAGGGRGRFSLTAFTTCMASQGVTVKLPTRPRNGTPPSTAPGETRPEPPAGGGFGGFGGNLADRFKTAPAGVDPTKYAAAFAACQSKLPTGRGGAAFNSSAFRAYRSCLADHGVTIPATGGFGSINRSDPKVQAAMKTCQPLLPAGGFGRTTTTTTTTPSA